MGRYIPENFKDSLLARINIVDVIGQYLPLKRTGTFFSTMCPFHADSNPSFKVNPQRQFYHCFGCQKGGNVISFMMEYHGYSFVEAIEALADHAGETVPYNESSPRDREDRMIAVREKKGFFELNTIAAEFFREEYERSEAARVYMERRGISETVATNFGIGFAPAAWDALVNRLTGEGRSALENAEKIGLLASKDGRRFYDKFRNRVMFPVYNTRDEIVGFSGRTLETADDVPKYLNSPDSKIFHKGKLLFGLSQARQPILHKKRVVLVEGNLDVLQMHQAGFDYTVAPLGTAFTIHQATLLKRFTSEVVLMFDGDHAGRKATLGAVETFTKLGVTTRAVALPQGEDPDTMLQRSQGDDEAEGQGAARLEELIELSEYGVKHIINTYVRPHRGDPVAAGRGFEVVAPLIEQIPNAVEREHYKKELMTILSISPDRRREYDWSMKNARRQPSREEQRGSAWELRPVRRLISILVDDPDLAVQLSDEVLGMFTLASAGQLLAAVRDYIEHNGRLDAAFLAQLKTADDLRRLVAEVFIGDPEVPVESSQDAFTIVITGVQRQHILKEVDKCKSLLHKGGITAAEKRELMIKISRLQARANSL